MGAQISILQLNSNNMEIFGFKYFERKVTDWIKFFSDDFPTAQNL